MSELKEVKVVFSDYSADSFALADALIAKVNLYKKTNVMEIFLNAKELISINELQKFKKYVIKRFNLRDVILRITTSIEDSEICKFINNEWKDILTYLSQKVPVIKAFMKNSTAKIENKTIEVSLNVKGKELLEKQNVNQYISKFIENIYGENLKVNFSENEIKRAESELDEKNKKIIEDFTRNSIQVIMNTSKKRVNSNGEENGYQNPQESDGGFQQNANDNANARYVQANGSYNSNQDGQNAGNSYNKNSKYNGQYGNKAQYGSSGNDNGNHNGSYNSNGMNNKNNNYSSNSEAEGLKEEVQDPNKIYGRFNPRQQMENIKIIDIGMDTTDVEISGEVVNMPDPTELKKTGKFLYSFDVYDGTSTITCKIFVTPDKKDSIDKNLKCGIGVTVRGKAGYDNFAKEITVLANSVMKAEISKKQERMDNAETKRVELHMHTQMSQMDAITPCVDLIKRAMEWGMKSIAITDHGVVQSFPDAHKLLDKIGYDKAGIKIIYGVEGYLVPDKEPVVTRYKGQSLEDTTYCVFDLETTGFSFRTEKITEIGIMKVRNGEVIDEFSSFVNPEKPIPMRVQEVTHITDEMVKDAPKIEEILPKVMEFFGDSVLVAHNANFDTSFIRYNCEKQGLKFENTYLDTLQLAKELFPDYKKYKLGIIAENLGIKVDVAHRALDDVITLVKVFAVILEKLKEQGVKTVTDIDIKGNENIDYKKLKSYHAIILTKNLVGLRNLYELVSEAHLNYFYKKPRIPKSLLKKHREGLIVGSACEAGELYRAIVARTIRRRNRRNSRFL